MLSARLFAIARTRALPFARASLHAAARTIKVPQMAESISEGTLKAWSKKEGDTVAADEEVATIETDKIDVSVNAPQSGTILKLLANEEDTVAVGQDLFILDPGEASSSHPPKQVPKVQQYAPKPSKPSPSPKVEKEVKKDVPPSTSVPPGSRNETRVKMNRMRLRIAERLKQSQNAAASLTTFNEIDMSQLLSLRKKYKDAILSDHGIKLGFMSFFARASILALKEIPAANASIEGEEIVYRDYVDLSVAVATPKGLVTPVVRNAESLSLVGIEKEIAALGKKAKDGKLSLEDMAGGTFTISNGGVFGSMFGTPIINLPQAAVLGMHAIKDRAVVVDGQVVVRPVMIVALTYDHRLLDGREAVTFLVRLREYLENPAKMLLTVY